MLDPKLYKYSAPLDSKHNIFGFADLNFFIHSLTNIKFNTALDSFDKIYCDGFWLYKLLKFKSYNVEYKTGPSFCKEVFHCLDRAVVLSKYSQRDFEKSLFYNSSYDIEFIELPFVEDVLEFDFMDIVAKLKLKCHIFVSLGCPKQEIFISHLIRSLKNKPKVYSVGAAIDFIIGNEIRAPKFMRLLKMEYLWRLLINFNKQKSKWKKIPTILIWYIKK